MSRQRDRVATGPSFSTHPDAPIVRVPSSSEAARDLVQSAKRIALTLASILAVLWGVGIVNALLGGALNVAGITPRAWVGLPGVLLWPFLHGGIAHLLANTFGLLFVGTAVLLRNERHFWFVTVVSTLLGGIGVWLFARDALHIGASGVIYGYLGYLFATGIFTRRAGAIAVSAVSILLWGGMLWGLLPLMPGVSFEGHIFGFLAGVVAARSLAKDDAKALHGR